MRTGRTQTQLVILMSGWAAQLQEGAKNRKWEVKSKILGSFKENYPTLFIKNII